MASIPASSDNVQTSDLCVSDVHKTLLLHNPDFIPYLVDGLLLDPDHGTLPPLLPDPRDRPDPQVPGPRDRPSFKVRLQLAGCPSVAILAQAWLSPLAMAKS